MLECDLAELVFARIVLDLGRVVLGCVSLGKGSSEGKVWEQVCWSESRAIWASK